MGCKCEYRRQAAAIKFTTTSSGVRTVKEHEKYFQHFNERDSHELFGDLIEDRMLLGELEWQHHIASDLRDAWRVILHGLDQVERFAMRGA